MLMGKSIVQGHPLLWEHLVVLEAPMDPVGQEQPVLARPACYTQLTGPTRLKIHSDPVLMVRAFTTESTSTPCPRARPSLLPMLAPWTSTCPARA